MNFRSLPGAIAGVVATGVMSVPMLVARRTGVVPALPPEVIVARFGFGSAKHPGSPLNQTLAAAAHLGFGAVCGLLFQGVASKLRVQVKRWPLAGLIYALGIWGASYMGWIPTFGILPPPEDDHPQRASLMFVSHLIFGLCLGSLAGRIRSRSDVRAADEQEI